VGGDAPDPRAIGFVGSVKWHERSAFDAPEGRTLARVRDAVRVGTAARGLAERRGG
jgi:hypothetical protein